MFRISFENLNEEDLPPLLALTKDLGHKRLVMDDEDYHPEHDDVDGIKLRYDAETGFFVERYLPNESAINGISVHGLAFEPMLNCLPDGKMKSTWLKWFSQDGVNGNG